MVTAKELKKMQDSEPSNEVIRLDLHDAAPDYVNSRTISVNTAPGVKITYEPGAPVVRLEKKGKVNYMPITNIKMIWMK